MKKFAVIGYPLNYSRSPEIHNRAFVNLGMNAVYEKLELVPQIFQLRIKEVKTQNEWSGFNVTIPFKKEIIPFLDALDQTAQAVGAVNTVEISDRGEWIGHNTDVIGFIKPLQTLPESPDSCLVIGAGGAARAVLFGLLSVIKPREIMVCNRTRSKAEELKNALAGRADIPIEVAALNEMTDCNRSFDLVVNTTSVGMGQLKDKQPLSLKGILRPGSVVYDLIYNPQETRLLQEASALGATTINGWPMLVYQAAASFRIWTGRDFPQEILQELLSLNS